MIPSCLSDSIADAERLDFGPRLPNKREGEYDSLELTNDAMQQGMGKMEKREWNVSREARRIVRRR